MSLSIFLNTVRSKRMVQFQTLKKKLFLTLNGQNVPRQQRKLSKFLMCYQQFASHAYCGAAGPVSKMASQQEKVFCVQCFEVSRSEITVQREFCARFRTTGSANATSSSKPCTRLTLPRSKIEPSSEARKTFVVCCNHQVHRDFLIILYNHFFKKINICRYRISRKWMLQFTPNCLSATHQQ
jgi:hypothetical protein